MALVIDAIVCGVISALTWAGLVWMSPEMPVIGSSGWLQGMGLVMGANFLTWLIFAGLRPHIAIWAIVFLVANILIGWLALPLCKKINVPGLWAIVIHPGLIAGMNVLLAGALGII
ncbi:hypothetical protein Pse7367_1991 [Thalassoporum mexicanum PCC 7367]|uniref:hypothetical protein n=1 Tax=Thalassoporum mexicanum TaxID=3457544 RepID=UPI00029F835E|nr:hypothetical protein [Pseudanabaena sp. PCC 7367]AFY70264.1 hypothetical protein Pse7367_1991 [Pseudanabaena sp. PCC 7367]